METFPDWLAAQLKIHGWSQSELARRSHLSQATISRLIRGVSEPGSEACAGIALALNLPLAEVLQHAGISTPKLDQSTQARFNAYLGHLTQDDLEALLHIVRQMSRNK